MTKKTIELIPTGLSEKAKANLKFQEFSALKTVGRKFEEGDTLLVPDTQVLYYHEIGWIALTIDQAKYYLEAQRQLDDEQAIEQEKVYSLSEGALTVATAKQELLKDLENKVVPVEDVQKMIDSAVKQALDEQAKRDKKDK